MLSFLYKTGIVPRIWCKGNNPCAQKGDPFNPDNFRPICALSCLCKFFTNILNSRLMDVCKKHNLIHTSQTGFLEGCRTINHIFSLKTLINKYTRERSATKTLCMFY